jgi:hypothetical protein
MPPDSQIQITGGEISKANTPNDDQLNSMPVTCTRQLADDILEKSLGQAVINYKQSVGFQIETLQMIEDIFAKATVDLNEKISSDPGQCWYSADENSQPKSCSSSSTEPEDLIHERKARQGIFDTGLTTNIQTDKSNSNPKCSKADDQRLPANGRATTSCRRGRIGDSGTIGPLAMPELFSDSIEAFTSECDTRASPVPIDKTHSHVSEVLSSLVSKPAKLFICTFDGCGKASIETPNISSLHPSSRSESIC